MGRRVSSGVVGGTGLGSLSVVSSTISSTITDGDITLDPNGTGIVQLDGNTQLRAQSDLRFADADSSAWVAFQAPATIASNITWTLPNADATVNGYALISNAAGVLSWSAAGAAISDNNTDSGTNYLTFTTSISGFLTAARVATTTRALTYQPSTGTLTSTQLRADGNTASSSRTTGTLVVTGGVGVSGALYVGGEVVAFAASDIRLKENISKIEGSLEKLSQISGYQHYWNKIAQEMHPERTMLDVGVIAQEVQKILPSAVIERDDGYLAVNYDKIIPLLIESIKALKEEIEGIKREI